MNAVLQWSATAFSLVGLVFNIRKSPWGFALWLVSNGLWFGFALQTRALGLAITQAVFAVFSIIGFAKWRQKT